ncbi:MAG TPA: hypothetical protein VG389_05525 [Myxococcota bacterium]|jgi:hypothetical protein|nr:hypothetical protein [Myxococcota bacterium]
MRAAAEVPRSAASNGSVPAARPAVALALSVAAAAAAATAALGGAACGGDGAPAAPPELLDVVPPVSWSGADTMLTLRGRGFVGYGGGAAARFGVTFDDASGGAPVALGAAERVSDEEVRAVLPAGAAAPGIYDVTLERPDGARATLAGAFQLYAGPPPEILSASPAAIPSVRESYLYLQVGALQPGFFVWLGATPAAVWDWDGASYLVLQIQSGIPPGIYPLLAQNPDGQYGAWNGTITVEPPTLEATLVATPDGAPVTSFVAVTLTITNVGDAAVAGVTPDPIDASGTGQLDLVDGPAPLQLGLSPGATGTFTYAYVAAFPGTVLLRATAAGYTAAGGAAYAAPALATVDVM